MVYLPPPNLATPSRPSYAEAYTRILIAHRSSPRTSASGVIIAVATDVDALCAARMLADLFKQDDVMHRIIPVSDHFEFGLIRNDLFEYSELHTLILLNIGSVLELTSSEWFEEFSTKMSVHVIDSSRPRDLANMFAAGENAEKIIIWDDGGAEELEEERKAFEAIQYQPEPDEDEDEDFSDDEEDTQDDYEDSSPTGKRRSLDDVERPNRGKRRRTDREQSNRMTYEERDLHNGRLHKHYMSGSWYGQSASGTIYILATVLERVDNELLWLAILGLTYQYTTSRISRSTYDIYHAIYFDEVFRLNPGHDASNATVATSPDDTSVRVSDELRFMLFRHWTLYDAMYHSSYVAGKLGIWKERGRKRLTGLLAKMGFSIPQTHQPYAHMDLDLKSSLIQKLQAIAPEYGLLELSYPSFIRCYGYRNQPLSASDAVEAVGALLDVAGGVRMEIEVEGGRGGGEWFGRGGLWEVGRREGNASVGSGPIKQSNEEDEGEEGKTGTSEVPWRVHNFWAAFDALSNIAPLQKALSLSMSLQRAIIRQGTSIIDKQDIRTMRAYRVVLLRQGPDLHLFSHPGVLSRLALWLVDALRDRLPGTVVGGRGGKKKGRKSLPFVVGCLKEHEKKYIIVGVMAALDFDDVRKNEFTVAFIDAKEKCKAEITHGTLDTTVIQIKEEDLKLFLDTLSLGPE